MTFRYMHNVMMLEELFIYVQKVSEYEHTPLGNLDIIPHHYPITIY